MLKKLPIKFFKPDGVWFLIFTLFVFIAYRYSLLIAIHGDDWMFISQYIGRYVPKYGSLNPIIFLGNYGISFFLGVMYPLFKDNSFYYYFLSLSLRVFCAYLIYVFVKTNISKNAGVIAGVSFSVIAIGAEVTGWFMHFTNYIGAIFLIISLNYIVDVKKGAAVSSYVKSTLLSYIAYMAMAVRLFIAPYIVFSLSVIDLLHKNIGFIRWLMFAIFIISPIFLLKYLIPSLGWSGTFGEMLVSGISNMPIIFEQDAYNLIFSPLINLGQMMIPFPSTSDGNFIYKGIIFYPLIFGSSYIFIRIAFSLTNKISVIRTLIFTFIINLFSYFVIMQTPRDTTMKLLDFGRLNFGIVLTIVLLYHFFYYNIKRSVKEVKLLTISTILLYSFMFTWLTEPGFVYSPIHRYLFFPGVGFVIIWSWILAISKTSNLLKVVAFSVWITLQIYASNKYFYREYISRPGYLNKLYFNQIKSQLSAISIEKRPIFYFEGFDPATYDLLLRFGFGYHISVIYNMPHKNDKFPTSTDDFTYLLEYIKNKNLPAEYVYSFKLKDGQLVNQTELVRDRLLLSI